MRQNDVVEIELSPTPLDAGAGTRYTGLLIKFNQIDQHQVGSRRPLRQTTWSPDQDPRLSRNTYARCRVELRILVEVLKVRTEPAVQQTEVHYTNHTF